MTEDDTFNALRRPAFDEVIFMAAMESWDGRHIIDGNIGLIQKCGWNIDEFRIQFQKAGIEHITSIYQRAGF